MIFYNYFIRVGLNLKFILEKHSDLAANGQEDIFYLEYHMYLIFQEQILSYNSYNYVNVKKNNFFILYFLLLATIK